MQQHLCKKLIREKGAVRPCCVRASIMCQEEHYSAGPGHTGTLHASEYDSFGFVEFVKSLFGILIPSPSS
jgi:hypothetical protein